MNFTNKTLKRFNFIQWCSTEFLLYGSILNSKCFFPRKEKCYITKKKLEIRLCGPARTGKKIHKEKTRQGCVDLRGVSPGGGRGAGGRGLHQAQAGIYIFHFILYTFADL